ncbi:MAG: M42 family metallopeptidase [Methanophagales archaeon]|nr:M42 family metallopeptidase [Methanophagales archaeon]MCW3138843.1 M42 family metallopeptidase [Methanophagales archaeon]MCW7070293.1 M42 family metallopeptidase [Methanophagales archaeon]MCW7073369.1 M42 family metallopeptidase [Methanophagales archaeon]
MRELKELLARLAEAGGISGYEGAIREIVEEELREYVDEIRTDRLGNLIARKGGKSPSVMIAAHLDEIGLMVKQIEPEGFLRFSTIGGWFDQTLLNQRVVLQPQLEGEGGDIVYGVIGSKPPHRMKKEEREKVIKAEDMFIDIGAKSEEEVSKLGITIGTPVIIDGYFTSLINDRVTCKAFDNRSGVAVMIEALRRVNTEFELYAVGTVQEEVGLKGARTSAFELNPDVAIAIDTDIAGGHPGIEKKETTVELDKGPVITVSDASGRGIITPPAVLKWLKDTASRYNIQYQLSVSEGGTTDATAIHLTRGGIPTGVIGVPTRYIHSPVELLSLNDLDKCAELIARALEHVGEFF